MKNLKFQILEIGTSRPLSQIYLRNPLIYYRKLSTQSIQQQKKHIKIE
jgi:hypothetical protein